MNRILKSYGGSFQIILAKQILIGMILTTFSVIYLYSIVYTNFEGKSFTEENASQVLREIHKEVVELGRYEDEEFIKREFFIDLDENQDNKEEHVVILEQTLYGIERMLIQVTYFEPKKQNRLIKYAKNTREIICFLEEDSLVIEKSGYDSNEIKNLLPRILEGIKNKKKLLKLIEHKKKQEEASR